MAEIDHLFASFGLAEMIPPFARYTMIASIVFIPCIVLALLLFCCGDPYEPPKPKKARVVAPEEPKPEAVATPKPKNKSLASLKKEKAEKID